MLLVRRLRRFRAGRGLVRYLLVVVLGGLLGLLGGPLPASASPTSSGGTSGTTSTSVLDDQILQTSQALHESALTLAAAQARVDHLQAALVQADAQLAQQHAEQLAARRQLQQAAVAAYVTGAGTAGSFGAVSALLGGSELQAAARAEYQGVVDGALATAVARWRAAQAQARIERRHLLALLQQARLARAQAAASQRQLHSQLAQEQQLLARVQAAEEAAARAAAQAAAAAATHPTPPEGTTSQGAPLVVSAQVLAPSPPAPVPPAAPAPAPVTPSSTGGSGSTPGSGQTSQASGPPASLAEDLARLRECESGDDYQADTGNGYYGAYQFSLQTWQSLGYSGLPSQAPPAEQDQAAATLAETVGWDQWPVCSALLGLQGRAQP